MMKNYVEWVAHRKKAIVLFWIACSIAGVFFAPSFLQACQTSFDAPPVQKPFIFKMKPSRYFLC